MLLTVEQWNALSEKEKETRKDEMPEELSSPSPKGKKGVEGDVDETGVPWKNRAEEQRRINEKMREELESLKGDKNKGDKLPANQEEWLEGQRQSIFGDLSDDYDDESDRKKEEQKQKKMIMIAAQYADKATDYKLNAIRQREKETRKFLNSLNTSDREDYGNAIQDEIDSIPLGHSVSTDEFKRALRLAKGDLYDKRIEEIKTKALKEAKEKREIMGEAVGSEELSEIDTSGLRITPEAKKLAVQLGLSNEEGAWLIKRRQEKKSKRKK